MAKKTLSDLFKRWAKRGRRATATSSPSWQRVRLGLEEVEHRLAPATLDPVTASDTRTIGAGFAPQAVADPNNPNNIVVVNASGGAIAGNVSKDGGQTWKAFAVPNPDVTLNSGPGAIQLTNANSPSIAFSSTGEVYITWVTTTADYSTAGRLRVDTYTFAGLTTAKPIPTATAVLYEWRGNAGAPGGQDPVYNPTVAVDNNVDQYADPAAPSVKVPQDTMLGSTGAGKAVYVAWNTFAGTPTVDASHGTIPPDLLVFTPTAIFTAASSDLGKSWTTPVPVDQGGYAAAVGGVDPQVLFTSGNLNPNETTNLVGRLQFVWTKPGGGGTTDITQPDGGVLATQVAANYQQSADTKNKGIADATANPTGGQPDIPGVTMSPLTITAADFNSTNGQFFSALSDINVTVAITTPHISHFQIYLIPPASTGVRPIQLLEARIDGLGRPVAPQLGFPAQTGLPDGQNLGITPGLGEVNVAGQLLSGTTFDAEAPRLIDDPSNASPYIDSFRPEGGNGFSFIANTANLTSLYGKSMASLIGTWTLEVVDVRFDGSNNPPTQFINDWSLHMSSLISNTGFGADVAVPSGFFGFSLGTNANLGGSGTSNATNLGVGGTISYAYDKTLGSTSPYSGRLYEVYAAPGPATTFTTVNGKTVVLTAEPDIFLRYSDNDGLPNADGTSSWSSAIRVNDDSVSDNVTEGDRTQLEPNVTVDPVTGTVIVMWYDARNDASNARVATYVATSIDGGDTFSQQSVNDSYLNSTKTALDEVTGSTVDLEAVPTNLRAAGAVNNNSEAGLRQSVLAYDGQIKAYWTGNQNTTASQIFTATVQTAAGPRVIDNDTFFDTDQGAVIADAPGGYNDTFTSDGTRQITGFTVTFDRYIDPSSFTTDDITVLFQAPTTSRGNAPTLIPLASVVPLDLNGFDSLEPTEATTFFVAFATPQSSVGTYSYSIGPNISDLVQSRKVAQFTPPDTPTTVLASAFTDSTLSVPIQAGTSTVVNGVLTFSAGTPTVQKMTLTLNLTLGLFADPDEIEYTLYGPAVNGVRPSETFADLSDFIVTPFVGSPIAGEWTLRVDNTGNDVASVLNGWSITFLDSTGTPLIVNQDGDYMDQDQDSRTDELAVSVPNGPTLYTDAFSAPGTIGEGNTANPFDLPLDSNTLPLIEPGPYLISTSVPSDPSNPDVIASSTFDSTKNLVLNGTASTIDLTFDRDIDPNSFTPANILQMTGPTGTISPSEDLTIGASGTFTVSFGGQTTDILPYNIPAAGGTGSTASLQNALDALTTIGAGNAIVTSTADPNVLGGTIYHITFVGVFNANQPTFSASDLAVSPSSDLVVSSVSHPFTAADVGSILNVTGGTGWKQGAYTIVNVANGAATLNASPAPANTKNGSFVVPMLLSAAGVTGAGNTYAPALTIERFQVAPIGTVGPDGGYTSFAITFPTQQFSGSYSLRFGPNPALPPSDPFYSIRSENIPELVTVLASPSNTLKVTFDQIIPDGDFTTDDILSVLGPNGALTAAQIANARIVSDPDPNNPTLSRYDIVFSDADFPSGLPAGQYVVDFSTLNAPLFVNLSGSPIDTNFNAGLSVLRGIDPTASMFVTQTYSSSGTATIDPATTDASGKVDPSITDLSITIPDEFIIDNDTLHNIELLLNINAPHDSDLNIDLIPPTGVLPADPADPTVIPAIRLFTGSLLATSNPNQTANFTNTLFEDRVNDPNDISIESGHPPFTAPAGNFFTPQMALGALLNASAKGVWTLRVTNFGTNGPTNDPNFKTNSTIQISNWSLTLPHTVPGTGLGEPVADQFQAGFRIFTQDPTNSLTQTTWTPVGPSSTNETANAARITTVAIDPSDPSGNTAYVAAAGGGVWKTTNFLTADPNGPTYMPLTDFGETNAVNVASIALFPRNNDPSQTIIFALTGESNTQGDVTGSYTSVGVGVLRSEDGGKTWVVLDSLTNIDPNGMLATISDPVRKHEFVGTSGYKIVVDPNPGPDGGVILYMALSGGSNPGVYRTINGGDTWELVQAGNATDVQLAAASANTTNPATGKTITNGNLQQMYAAFSSNVTNGEGGAVTGGPGVYVSFAATSATSLILMAGTGGRPLLRDISIPGDPQITVGNAANTPNGGQGRIALAVPALTGNVLEDSYLKDWLYALDATGLYVTKDAGQNWTHVQMPQVNISNLAGFNLLNGYGTNDTTRQPADLYDTGGFGTALARQQQAEYDLSVTVDPQNPNIVYLAGAGTTSYRVDITKLDDSQNFTFFDNSNPGINAANATTTGIQLNTVGGVQPQTPEHGYVVIGGVDDDGVGPFPDTDSEYTTDFLNLSRNFDEPFLTNSTIRVVNTGNFPVTSAAGQFVNDGSGAQITPFSDLLQNFNLPDASGAGNDFNPYTGLPEDENRNPAVNVHQIFSIVDPVTGKTRLIYATDDGVFTGVDNGDQSGTGTLSSGIGFSAVANNNRNGNLQISQFVSGAVQPSQTAADIAGALFYGMGDGSGFPVSSADILTTGNTNWRGPVGTGIAVSTDAGGNGTAFEYRAPGDSGDDENSTATVFDFYRVIQGGADPAFSGGIGRTGNASGSLIQGNEIPGQPGSQWPYHVNPTSFFNPEPNYLGYTEPSNQSTLQPAINPVNDADLLIGSSTGNLFLSTDQGNSWHATASASTFNNSIVQSVAFGATDPAQPTKTANFLYVGTANGSIYSSNSGGSTWTLVGSAATGLDGSSVLEIVPNPTLGAKDVFAITTKGVYYKPDGTAAGAAAPWVNLTGTLFSVKQAVFGDSSNMVNALVAGGLTSIAVDWRYAFTSKIDPNGAPILYVGGNGGVFRSIDLGANWTFYPDVADDGAPVDGGYLPDTHITDLDLSIGNINPSTGKYEAGGLNMLVATTYGRGTYAIRLADIPLPIGNFISGPSVSELIDPGVAGEIDVQFNGQVDPTTFSPSDVFLVGPDGNPLTVTGVQMISTTNANTGNPRNLFEIDFDNPKNLKGSYTVTIGYNPNGNNVPEVSDPGGNLMNQNGNGVNGEPIVDQFNGTIQLNTGTTDELVVTSYPATTTAGVSQTVTIKVLDDSTPNNNYLTNVNGLLSFNLPSGVTVAPISPATDIRLVNGVATFTVTYDLVGPAPSGDQTIGVTFASPPPAINGTSWTTAVVAAATSQLAIVPANATIPPGPLTFTVKAEDQFGNLTDNYTQTATLTSTGVPDTIPDTVDLTNGVGSFTGIFDTSTMTASGTNVPIQITATGPNPNNPGTTVSGTASVTVNPGGADHLSYIIDPAGSAFTTKQTVKITVLALDAEGNRVTTYDGTLPNLGVVSGAATFSNVTAFANGAATFNVTFTTQGSVTLSAATTKAPLLAENIGPLAISAAPPPVSPTQNLTGQFAVGTGVKGSPVITIYNGANGNQLTSFIPFPPGFENQVDPSSGGFTGGERVAVGDVTGDGVPDYVVGTGPGITAAVVVVDGKTNQTVLTYFPFDTFTGGVFVAVGSIQGKIGSTGLPIDDIVITPDQGGGPRVILLSGGDFNRFGNFYGINDPNFRGGARPAVGDLNGDGHGELVISAGYGGGPRISVFDGAALAKGAFSHPVGDFYMFDPSLRNGAYVAIGDVDGDGFADIIGGAGPGGGPRVFVISGKTLLEQGPEQALNAPIANFFGGNPDNRGGIPVAAKNVDGDRDTDILTGVGEGGGSTATMYLGANVVDGDFNPFYQIDTLPGYTGGVFVG